MVTTSFGVQAGPLRKWYLLKNLNFKHSHVWHHTPDGTESRCCYFCWQQLRGGVKISWKQCDKGHLVQSCGSVHIRSPQHTQRGRQQLVMHAVLAAWAQKDFEN